MNCFKANALACRFLVRLGDLTSNGGMRRWIAEI